MFTAKGGIPQVRPRPNWKSTRGAAFPSFPNTTDCTIRQPSVTKDGYGYVDSDQGDGGASGLLIVEARLEEAFASPRTHWATTCRKCAPIAEGEALGRIVGMGESLWSVSSLDALRNAD